MVKERGDTVLMEFNSTDYNISIVLTCFSLKRGSQRVELRHSYQLAVSAGNPQLSLLLEEGMRPSRTVSFEQSSTYTDEEIRRKVSFWLMTLFHASSIKAYFF